MDADLFACPDAEHLGRAPTADRDRDVLVCVLVEDDVARTSIGERTRSDNVVALGAELELGPERYYVVAARTFADARPGDIILYEDAYKNVAIAISGGSAAEMFGVGAGEEVRIHLRTP